MRVLDPGFLVVKVLTSRIGRRLAIHTQWLPNGAGTKAPYIQDD